MRRLVSPLTTISLCASAFLLLSAFVPATNQTVLLPGLKASVEVLRDRWGVPHIYAQNQDDLFLAQGYITARDRLFQLDLWRRIGEGRLSEVLGSNFLARDRIARLVRYRGDWDKEWNSYAPDAKNIATSFTNGINAYINSLKGKRPQEFDLAGFDPGLWIPEDVTSRIAGLSMTGNMLQEVARAQSVARLGLPTVQLLSPPDPFLKMQVPRGLDLGDITSSIVHDYATAVGPIHFPGEQGSNNWVVDGTMTRSGKPLLANDPHRAVLLPSLRKTVHLVAPGWNVIGAGEPALPGVALGHNDNIAFGFTIVGIDQQDLYVEKTNPDNPAQYMFKGEWHNFTVERQQIPVRGAGTDAGEPSTVTPEAVDLKYTIHGPVIYQDPTRHRVFSLKWVGDMPGTAGYLPALRLARARNWQDFRSAAAAYKVPSENLVYADRQGNIGWIAAGLAPIRRGWVGLFPVPGDTGDYEWNGFLPPDENPWTYNPPRHFIATANHNILPPNYPHELSYYWASPTRYQRIVELLKTQDKFNVDDFARMQQDTVSLVGRDFIDLLKGWQPPEGSQEAAFKAQMLAWDSNVAKDSQAALLYEVWTARLGTKLTAKVLPSARIDPRVVLQSLKANPQLNDLLAASLREAIALISKRLGPDRSQWTWGNLHKVSFRHPLDLESPSEPAVTLPTENQTLSRREQIIDGFDLPPVARPGDGNTINATGGPNFTQAYGASYRQVIDLGDWDRSVMTNVPGEVGAPGDKHYADLVEGWANGEYHPLPFSRKAVEAAAEERIVLQPAL